MKTIITMTVQELAAAGATFNPNGNRAANGLDVTLVDASNNVLLECRQHIGEGAVHYATFETFSTSHSQSVQEELKEFGVDFKVSHVDGFGIKVNVLDLLDTHWMLVQKIGEATLHITAPNGDHFNLQFCNDGHNLYAQFDATEENLPYGGLLMTALNSNATKYEVL